MPSEVVSKESEVSLEAKNIKDKTDTKVESKENGSEETNVNAEVQSSEKSEVSNGAEGLSENENKENEEPVVEDEETLKKLADDLLIDGKRHLIIGDFQAAVNVLSEACSAFGTAYGEMAEECAEAYFKYGCALLELSKDQINPVGLQEKEDEDNEEMSIQEESVSEINNDVSNTSSVQTDKVDELLKNKNDEEVSADQEKPDKKVSVDQEKLDKEVSDDKEKLDEVEEQSTEKEETSVNDEENSDRENADEDLEEDDVNDLQLAWEMLDLAKVIYKNTDTEESKLKLAEVLMKCGEVSFEDEKFETAIEDMTESLEIRRLLLPEDSRIIAETLFQMGIAQELGGSSVKAIELLTEAATVLEQRIKNLENSTDEKAIEEVAEIKSIIPEIKEKIVDLKERKQAIVCALKAAVGNEALKNGGPTSSTGKQVSNINHLVRKRPKQEDTNSTTVPNKVPKLEESTSSEK